ncbi:divergent polysaccharide deacetylase family protein [uncultured Maritimibacter sp.]|uniref:divergent polysaccharide deacetylase family protein n=1 Tax=uncultured Maritimibacter sp. TaxID=991866 RepID=UPI00261D51A3|nr:divergent polysaccharide deacetylase family protein [uncultured Maritimibacter sp.]
MIRGLISGIIVGGVVAAGGVGAVALLVEPVVLEPGAPDAAVPSDTPEAAVVPEVSAPEPLDPPSDTAPDNTVTQLPVGEPGPTVDLPLDEAEEIPAEDAPMAEQDTAPVIEAPVDDEPEAAGVVAEPVEETGAEIAAVEPQAETPDAGSAEAETETAEAEPPVADTPETTAPEEEVSALAEPEASMPEVAEPPATDNTPPSEPAPEDVSEASQADTPPSAPQPSDPPAAETTVTETDDGTLIAGAGQVTPGVDTEEDRLGGDPEPPQPAVSERLPRIGDEPAAEAEPPSPLAEDVPLLRKNALDFTTIPELPEMAVVLLDTGPGREEVGDVALMPFPLSVAVDASQPDAEAAIDYYRANNAEVILVVPFPPGVTATDVDVTMQAYDALLDKVVAVMVPESVGFQNAGDAAAQLATVLGEKGLGLLSYPAGLNTGHKTAVSEGVPATLVFRDLDPEGQSPDVIRRFLDNVAFRARNEEGTVALARVRPDSLQALLEWSLGNRAQTVNLAPLSALLIEQM